MTDDAMLVARRPRNEQRRRVKLSFDEASDRMLAELRHFYTDTLGRRVSSTVMVRRALALLVHHVRSIRPEQVDMEMAAIMKVLG